jgi:hypothetical protein
MTTRCSGQQVETVLRQFDFGCSVTAPFARGEVESGGRRAGGQVPPNALAKRTGAFAVHNANVSNSLSKGLV